MNRVAATKATNMTMAETLRGWRCTSPVRASAASRGETRPVNSSRDLPFMIALPEDLSGSAVKLAVGPGNT